VVFLDIGLLALVVGWLLGGRLSALAETEIKAPWLAFAAIGLQLIAFPSDVLPWSTPSAVARVLWLASYALLVLMLFVNSRLAGAPIVGAGLGCNLVAIAANRGLMPVRGSALRAAGTAYHVHNNSIELARPHLSFLVDRWAAPPFVPLANVYSIGDILIAIGTIVAIVAAMRAPLPVVEVTGSVGLSS
jgi:Family of unknown function (DUF5317)